MNRKQRRARGESGLVSAKGSRSVKAVIKKTRMLLEQGKYAQVVDVAQEALDGAGHTAELWLLLAQAYEQLNARSQAYKCLKMTVELAPDNAEGWQQLGRILHNGNRFEASEVALEKSLSIRPDNPETLKLLALARYALGDTKGSHWACDRAMTLRPEWDQLFYIKGLIYKSAGQYTEACEALERAHKLNPEMIDALFELVEIAEIDQLDGLIGKLSAFRDAGSSDPLKMSALQFSFANVHRRRKEFDEAFACYESANELAKNAYTFDRDAHTNSIDETIAAFTPRVFEKSRSGSNTSSRPIFIVGMPRSGTSLTEQIISSHADVFGGGECYVLKAIADALKNAQGNALSYPADVARIDDASLSSLAGEYLARVDRICPPDARHVTDKMVFNFLHLGLIALLFPNASIIHCQRDPMDTCLSCYFQRFNSGDQLSFTFDLQDLGFYYREYHRLMAHWREVLPIRVLDVQYETLIAAPETESKRILDYIGLDWDEACLNFHKQDRAVLTASVVQARQPVYKTSAGRWRRYEKHLGTLLEALGDLAPSD